MSLHIQPMDPAKHRGLAHLGHCTSHLCTVVSCLLLHRGTLHDVMIPRCATTIPPRISPKPFDPTHARVPLRGGHDTRWVPKNKS